MTRLLVSVKDHEEARLAAAAGTDLIDAKDPAQSLGALPPEAIAAIVAAIGGTRETSAVAGDHDDLDGLVASARAVAATGVGFVKVGLRAGLVTADAIARTGAALEGRGRFVAVLFADGAADLAPIEALARAGFAGAMMDTLSKGSGRLLDFMALDRLASFVIVCRRERLMSGLAGSLRLDDIPALLPLAPDYLGFRGGLCSGGDRRGRLDATLIARAAALIAAPAREAAA